MSLFIYFHELNIARFALNLCIAKLVKQIQDISFPAKKRKDKIKPKQTGSSRIIFRTEPHVNHGARLTLKNPEVNH